MSKRIFDFCAALVGLLVLSPVLALVAIAIRRDSGGPVFFRQVRIGRNFRPFTLFKFRTMTTNASAGGTSVTIEGDPRITRVGRGLRRLKLDELPQLINVLRGEMSFVGPRPELPEFVARFHSEYKQILQVLPGITDPASLRYRDEATELGCRADPERAYVEEVLPDKLRLAAEYVARASFWRDIGIIFQTIFAVVTHAISSRRSEPDPTQAAQRGARDLASTIHRRLAALLYSRGAQMLADFCVAGASLVGAVFLRFDGAPPDLELHRAALLLAYVCLARVAVAWLAGIYDQVWRYVSVGDTLQIVRVNLAVSAALLLLRLTLVHRHTYLTLPLGVILMDYVLTSCGMVGVRLLRRVTHEREVRSSTRAPRTRRRVLLVGAGAAGVMTLKELTTRPDLGMDVCGFVDDDLKKARMRIHGVPVLGSSAELAGLVRAHGVDQVVIAMASAPPAAVKRIVQSCAQAQVPVQIVPGLFEILDNRVSVSKLRRVEIEDLLGRPSVNFDTWKQGSRSAYGGRTVLVTGAGGSIGRELCRQVLALEPRCVLLLDKDENALFETQQLLAPLLATSAVQTQVLVADLRMRKRLHKIVAGYQPQVILHAAAHKHVPLMEDNPAEAVLNNVLGTANLLAEVAEAGVERCVMVSTDKAVNPTSVMGATKRLAEMMFQAEAQRCNGAARYSCVRFGNVLGSRGSVIPTFRDQISRGGPVTITHPDMVRYFMTIAEAAQLIIQAGAMGQRGEIFLLDMGQPVRIVDLAREMIELSGLVVGDDIEIEFIGMRPGEKLREELLIATEGSTPTVFEKIFVAPPLDFDHARLEHQIADLTDKALHSQDREVIALLGAMEIGYAPLRVTSDLAAIAVAGA